MNIIKVLNIFFKHKGEIYVEFIEAYKGIKQFGKAYEIMLENDSHAPNSVDIELIQNMIKLCDETKDYLYETYTPPAVKYKRGSRPVIEAIINCIIQHYNNDENRILAIAEYCSNLSNKMLDADSNNMLLGGTEEEIIERGNGSDWCTDISRVGCIMYQAAGFPSRIVNTFNLDHAYSGHVVNEVYRNGIWGVVDTTNGIVYYHHGKKPVTSWEVMNRVNTVVGLKYDGSLVKIDFDQFKGVAISNYLASNHIEYNYSISRVNNYYSKILEASYEGWPGGLRWIHNEDSNMRLSPISDISGI